jgi:hypothetical protein
MISHYYTKQGPGIGMRDLPRRKVRWTVIETASRNSTGDPYIDKTLSLEDVKNICRTIRQNYSETIYSIAEELGMSGAHLSKIIKGYGLPIHSRDGKRKEG